ncbi:Peptidase family M23 [Micromonospora halophytica]|uniref:Peptidase family M23 n=1 Tax=Micromonospora halophytica TaxID=47864 RepID=A0A1C5IJC7_9ACTN|nr:Peptidase family M23 [Micromonospora halophytica]
MRQQLRRATAWGALLVLGTLGGPAVAGGRAPVPTTRTVAQAAGAVTPGAATVVATGAAVTLPGAAAGVPGAAATAGSPGRDGLRPQFRWPLDGTPRPVRRFDPPPQPWLPGHRGVDLAAAPGATVRAAGPGTVLFAGMVAGRPVVTVGHAAGLRTTYEPVHPDVRPGDPVPAGTPLGVLLAGHPACETAGCLHWGLRRGPEYLDPLALLGLGPVRLLPVADGHAAALPVADGHAAALPVTHGHATVPSSGGAGAGGLVAPAPLAVTPSSGGPGAGGLVVPLAVTPDPWTGTGHRRWGSVCRCGHRGERADQPRASSAGSRAASRSYSAGEL